MISKSFTSNCSTISFSRQTTAYPVDVIAQCVRWYLTYALSPRDLEEMMNEREIVVDHSTHHRWVIRIVPLLDNAFRRHKRAVGHRWRMDEIGCIRLFCKRLCN